MLASVFLDRKNASLPTWFMASLAAIAIIAAGLIALGHPPFLTRIMLALELITVSLIVLASLYMLFVLVTKGGPQGSNRRRPRCRCRGDNHGARARVGDWIPVVRRIRGCGSIGR